MANKEEEQSGLRRADALGPQTARSPASLSSADKLEEELRKLKEELQRTELSLVTGAQLSEEELKVTQDRLYKMIDYTVKRHDWFVDQCHRLLQIGLALIASGSAVGAIFGKLENLPRITEYLAWAFALSLFGTGLRLVYWYNNYLSGEHPYRKAVDITSWFFKYRFPQGLAPNLSSSPETAIQQVAQEVDNIKKYFDKFLEHAKNNLNLVREDIEQVAILLILQRYRDQQVKRMAKSLYRGLVLTTVVFVVLIACVLFIAHPRQPSAGASTASTPARTAPAANPPTTTTPATPGPATDKPTPAEPPPTKPAAHAKPTHARPNPAAQPPP